MDIHFSADSAATCDSDLVIVGAGSDWANELTELDGLLDGELSSWLEETRFGGQLGDTAVIPTFGKLACKRLGVVGVAEGRSSDLAEAAGHAGRLALARGAAQIAVDLALDPTRVIEFVIAGNYSFDKYKSESSIMAAIESLTILGQGTGEMADRATTVARWQREARDLVNLPAADIYPASLAERARKLASIDHVVVEVWDFERCREEGCVGIVAVGQGSSNPGALIHIRYSPPNARDHVAIVGKGVTFDSGGLSLKPSGSMQTMRCDMGGAAVALAATGAVAELGIPVTIDTFIPAVENMNGANSYKLGDILRYTNGTTVEIHNTDAEGRLVLADGLIQASAIEGVSTIIDLATLTGAVVVAIGPDFTGLFTADDGLADELSSAAEVACERLWRLPLHTPYKRMLKGEWGQIKNVGGRDAGATTAALFLSHFVKEGVRWAHLDIAGSAFQDKPASLWASGGTGQMVRTLTLWANSLT